MRLLAALIVLVAAAPVHAETCKPGGGAIFEIDELITQQPTAKITTLYDSGAWTTRSTTADGKPGPSSSGCLAKDKLAKIRTDLKAMQWKVVHRRVHCMMVSPAYTAYKIGDKTMWTQRVCSPDALDDESQAKLTEITALLTASA